MADWSLYGGADSFEMFQVWEMSNYVVYPFPGGWSDQPVWVRRDFKTLLKVRRWWSLNKKRPVVDGLPSIEDAG